MEELGGAMGLSEIINTTDLSSTSPNNIDVHMEKNTEYGALVILSASSYGNPNKVEAGQTTTGNATGVLMRLGGEWVAAATTKNNYWDKYNSAKSRYKNVYDTQKGILGDAMFETSKWHGAGTDAWNISYQGGIVRAWNGSVFSYSANTAQTASAYYSRSYPTRAVVVSGEGL